MADMAGRADRDGRARGGGHRLGPGIKGSRLSAPSASVRRSVAVLALKNLSGQAEHAWFSTALTETIGAELMAGGAVQNGVR